MNILVTGGTGFIGGYFVPMLIRDGHKVRLLVRDKEKAIRQFGDVCEYFVGDVTDKGSITGCCKDIDVVFHLVAKSGNELPTKENFEQFRKVNVEGTKNIISECGDIKRFIYVSSTAAMGLVKDVPISERTKCCPYLPYQVTKYEAEEYIREKCKDGFPGIIIRPTKVYGVNEKDYSYLTLARTCRKGFFLKVGNGKNYTSNIYVSDFARVMVKLIENGMIGQTYIVTTEESIEFLRVGEIISDELGKRIKLIKLPTWFMLFAATLEERFFVFLGKKPIVTRKNIEMTIQDRIYDVSKAKIEIGFESTVTMEEGIRTVVRWYKEIGVI